MKYLFEIVCIILSLWVRYSPHQYFMSRISHLLSSRSWCLWLATKYCQNETKTETNNNYHFHSLLQLTSFKVCHRNLVKINVDNGGERINLSGDFSLNLQKVFQEANIVLDMGLMILGEPLTHNNPQYWNIHLNGSISIKYFWNSLRFA